MVKIQSQVLLTAQEDHPLFVWQLLLLKSEHLFFLLNRRNTDKHYSSTNRQQSILNIVTTLWLFHPQIHDTHSTFLCPLECYL